jgi:spore coat polysaccharide biosynthesis protein SpsF (cytidylyltransferase family)
VNKNVVVIIQAGLGSSRLLAKVLIDFSGKRGFIFDGERHDAFRCYVVAIKSMFKKRRV